MKKPRKPTISAQEASDLFGLSVEWLRQLGHAGAFPPADRGIYHLEELAAGLVRWYRTKAPTTDGEVSVEDLRRGRLAKMEAETALLKMERDRLRKQLLPALYVQLVIEGLATNYRRTVDNLPITEGQKHELGLAMSDVNMEQCMTDALTRFRPDGGDLYEEQTETQSRHSRGPVDTGEGVPGDNRATVPPRSDTTPGDTSKTERQA